VGGLPDPDIWSSDFQMLYSSIWRRLSLDKLKLDIQVQEQNGLGNDMGNYVNQRLKNSASDTHCTYFVQLAPGSIYPG